MQRLGVLLNDLLLYNTCVAKHSERRTIVEMLLVDGVAEIISSDAVNMKASTNKSLMSLMCGDFCFQNNSWIILFF